MRKIPDKWKEILNNLYKEEPYLLVRYSSTELAKKLNISASYMRSILSYYGYSFKKDIYKLLTDYQPYKYTYKEIKRLAKINVHRNVVNKYSKKIYGISLIHEKDKEYMELEEEWKELLREYKYPVIQLSKKGIRKYLGLTEKQFFTFKNKINYDFSIKSEVKRLFSEYNLSIYTPKEIAFDLCIEQQRIYKWIHRYKVGKKNKRPLSISRVKAEKELYGTVGSERKMSLKDIKIYFEDKLRINGEVTTKELRTLGYKSFNKWLYTIKKRYGINVDYKYNKKELKYELV